MVCQITTQYNTLSYNLYGTECSILCSTYLTHTDVTVVIVCSCDCRPWSNEPIPDYHKRTSNNTYTGEYDENELYHGTGALIGVNGDQYIGEFLHGQMHGYGKYIYNIHHSDTNNNNTTVDNTTHDVYYDGQFMNGQFNGAGVETYIDHSKYQGTFQNGQRHGYGTMTYGHQNSNELTTKYIVSYTGQWMNGSKHGTGKLVYSDNSEYSGMFVDGRRHGSGVCIDRNGNSNKVLYKNGKLQVKRKSVISVPHNNQSTGNQQLNNNPHIDISTTHPDRVTSITQPVSDTGKHTDESVSTDSTSTTESDLNESMKQWHDTKLDNTSNMCTPHKSDDINDIPSVAKFASPIHQQQLTKRHTNEQTQHNSSELIG